MYVLKYKLKTLGVNNNTYEVGSRKNLEEPVTTSFVLK